MNFDKSSILFALFSVTLVFSAYLLSNSISLSISEAPILFTVDGKQVLFYEVYVSNYSSLTPSKLEVLNGNNEVIYSIAGDEFTETFMPPKNGVYETTIRMWVELDSVPSNISHRLYFADSSLTVSGASTPIIVKPLLQIQPPLRNGNWLAANAPSNLNPHRSAIFEVMGKRYVPERYAIDWVITDEAGAWGTNEGASNEDYYCYGQDLLAVADGTIVDVRDGIPTNAPGAFPSGLHFATVGGNYAVLDMHNGYYAFYAHIIPGTLTVKNGDNVTVGQVLGKLGNTGNSDAPHLHFHICDSMDYIFCHGQPYTFDYTTLNGTIGNFKSMPSDMQELEWN